MRALTLHWLAAPARNISTQQVYAARAEKVKFPLLEIELLRKNATYLGGTARDFLGGGRDSLYSTVEIHSLLCSSDSVCGEMNLCYYCGWYRFHFYSQDVWRSGCLRRLERISPHRPRVDDHETDAALRFAS